MVSMDGNVVKLIDFGMSKVASSQSVSTIPREGISLFFFFSPPTFYPFFLNVLKLMLVCLALGTIRWGAPETFDYPALWTDKADIYSLGMTFWEIASRKVPFEDVSEPRCTILFPILVSFLLSLLLSFICIWRSSFICMIGVKRHSSHPLCANTKVAPTDTFRLSSSILLWPLYCTSR